MSSQQLVLKKKKKNKEKQIKKLKENQYVSRYNNEDLEDVAKELKDIQNNEGLNAQNVLERAKNKSNLLHKFFTWDDTKAAENWRRWQARYIISSVRIVISGSPVQAFESIKVNVTDDNNLVRKERRYVDIITIKSNKEYENQVLNNALKEIKHWQDKYKKLQRLNPVFEAIESIEKEVSDE